MDKLQYNSQTGRYEADYDGRPIAIDSDVMSEEKNDQARQRFGKDYADLDAAETNKIDDETEEAFVWADAT